jgi:adenylyltransferase/sulfurtransferase
MTGRIIRPKILKFVTALWPERNAFYQAGMMMTANTTEKKMAVKVIIPTPLRVYAGKKDSAEVSAQTVGEALGGLTSQFGELRKHLFTDDGKLRSFVNVYLNDEDIRYMAKEATPVKDGDVVSIVPSIAGGNHCGL